jgi:hypothetical protein
MMASSMPYDTLTSYDDEESNNMYAAPDTVNGVGSEE